MTASRARAVSLSDLLGRNSDLVLAGAVVAAVAILIVGVSPAVMDILITVNISVSVLVLLTALYANEAIRLPAMPTVLLFTTLLRLALNVSSTRLILRDREAGEIILRFGELVAGSSVVVGGVVFVVLTVIQLLVIAKGAERVSEVSARFSLDAMPGKQMAIDADLRAGLIDEQTARARRDAIATESKLHGAMEGAMKFVKGDAIAGILIAAVNLLGGLAIGLGDGMDLGQAARVFSILTIGDGLVAQIPSILISVAAGVITTRVAAADKPAGSLLANDLLQQFGGNPRVLGVTATLLGLLAVAGIVPWPAATALAVVCVSLAGARLRASRAAQAAMVVSRQRGGEVAAPGASATAPDPLVIEIEAGLEPLFVAGGEGTQALDKAVKAVGSTLGVELPPFAVRRLGRGEHRYHLLGHDGLLDSGVLWPRLPLALLGSAEFKARGLTATESDVPLPGTRAKVQRLTTTQAEAARAKGVRTLDGMSAFIGHLKVVLAEHAALFLGIHETTQRVEALSPQREKFVNALLNNKHLQAADITEVLKLLLHEQVPIRDLSQILEGMVRWAAPLRADQPEAGADFARDMAGRIRRELRRALCTRLTNDQRVLEVYRVSAEIEELLRSVATVGGLEPAQRQALVGAVASAMDPLQHLDRPPVLLVADDVRWAMVDLLAAQLREVRVLAFAEVPVELRCETRAVISLDPAPLSAAG